ncbi:MAG: TRAP transporter small permease [Rhodobacteraceae bacterium]|nr:TRAP transporter small permease [Paracoccaceae bacterium]
MTLRALRFAANLPLRLAAVMLFIMMVLTFADVIGRSTFSAPIPGAAELTAILLAAVVFLALPATGFLDRHISVDLIDGALSERVRRYRDAAINIGFAVALYWPIKAAWTSATRTLGYGEVTLYLGFSVGAIGMAITVGLAAGALSLLLRGVALLAFPDALTRMERSLGPN